MLQSPQNLNPAHGSVILRLKITFNCKHLVFCRRPRSFVGVYFIGRNELLPAVGHSNCSSNVWRLTPLTLRFALNGPLPYDKVHLPGCYGYSPL